MTFPAAPWRHVVASLSAWLLLLLVTTTSTQNHHPLLCSAASTSNVDHGKAQIEWLKSRGGFVSSKLEIRKVDPNDEYSRTAMFAKEAFAQDETLLILPKGDANVIVSAEGQEEAYGDEFQCGLARNLINELKKGNASPHSAYINYLNDQPYGQLPSAWSPAGQALLNELLSATALPPSEPTEWMAEFEHCIDVSDPFEVNAIMMVLQRSWDDLLLPVYDMMSHRNEPYLNTECNSVHDPDEPITVYASRDIEAGEELYTSYNLCEDCEARYETYGTPEILRDYGFVEQYPQRWIFLPHDLAFEITDVVDEEEIDVDLEEGGVILHWLFDKYPTPTSVAWMNEQLTYLQGGAKAILEKADSSIPPHELETIHNYLNALEFAFTLALQAAEHIKDPCEEEGTCTAGMIDLANYEQEHQWYWIDSCDNSEIFREFTEEYEVMEEIQSPYQLVGFFRDPENNDMCFELDSVTQICSSYRPHYHEMVVHYTARFLPKIERVLFVGGGDSMLLHEILKYPDLEFVVGLEIDQKVTRNAYKYFGSQPHWDNDKVQWWYGDAAKSLMMLPEDYFGSFDMVLVDLSETVMSLKVTDGLDIMEALGLLLKPEGILVKNEMYFEKLKDIYEHTVLIRFFDCPVICHQGLALGSHHNPMIPRTLTDHGLDDQNLFIGPLTDAYHHSFIHDYNQDESNNGHCKRENDTLGAVPPKQIESPGILMIIEAEDIAIASKTIPEIQSILTTAMESQGMKVTSTLTSADVSVDSKVVTVTFEEGFVVAKIFENEKYCAFDLHMWSKTGEQVAVKDALLQAVGAKSSSQLRVVAGGMFGMEKWKDDQSKRGPRRTDSCDNVQKPTMENPLEQTFVDSVIKESLNFSTEELGLIAVVCGFERDGPCQTLEALKKIKDENEILPLYSCPNIVGYGEDMLEKTIECKESIIELFEAEEEMIEALILDSNASLGMSGVIAKAMGPTSWQKYFDPEILVLSLAKETESINWRPNFFKRVQTELVIHEPVFRAEVNFNSTLILNVLSTDEKFTVQLNETNNAIERDSGLVADVRKVRGGHFNYQYDFDPTYFFKPSDYDQSGPFKQWNSQKPLERQVLFQLETTKPFAASMHKTSFQKALKAEGIDATITEQPVEGQGSLLIALWPEGRAVALWDGRSHVDINLTFPANIDPKKFDAFTSHITKNVKGMSVMLRDEQSRGIGSVVNFIGDIESTETPYWMLE